MLCRNVLFAGLCCLAQPALTDPYVLVADGGAEEIVEYDETGAEVGLWTSSFGDVGPIIFTPAGEVYAGLTSQQVNLIRRYSDTGVDLGNFAGFGTPASFAFDVDGNLYVSAFRGTRVSVLDPDGNGTGLSFEGLREPAQIGFDSLGNLFVAESFFHRVRKFAPDGTDLGVFATADMCVPLGLAVDCADNVYVSSSTEICGGGHAGTIQYFAPDGTHLGQFASVPASLAARALEWGPDGNLYLVNTLGDVYRFAPDGTSLGPFFDAFDSNPQTLPSGIAFRVGRAHSDSDGVRDICDACPHELVDDVDGDEVCAGATANPSLGFTEANDNCPTLPNADQADADGDGVGDVCDNCIEVANADQRDTDGDGYGNACDADFDQSCSVEFDDLNIMKLSFFAVGDTDTDLDGDGETGFADLNQLKLLFFGAPGPSAFTSVCQ